MYNIRDIIYNSNKMINTGADHKVNRTLELANELQASFRKNHRVLCCSVHTKGMDMGSGEHKEQCIAFTGEMARKTSEVIVRELDIVNSDD